MSPGNLVYFSAISSLSLAHPLPVAQICLLLIFISVFVFLSPCRLCARDLSPPFPQSVSKSSDFALPSSAFALYNIEQHKGMWHLLRDGEVGREGVAGRGDLVVIWWLAALLMAKGLELVGLQGPFQPKPCYGSVIPVLSLAVQHRKL